MAAPSPRVTLRSYQHPTPASKSKEAPPKVQNLRGPNLPYLPPSPPPPLTPNPRGTGSHTVCLVFLVFFFFFTVFFFVLVFLIVFFFVLVFLVFFFLVFLIVFCGWMDLGGSDRGRGGLIFFCH